MKKFAILAVLALAVTANAAISISVSAPEDLGNGLCKYVISATTDNPGGVNGVDGTVTGNLNQVTMVPFLPTSPFLDDFSGYVDLSQDTHFMAYSADVLQGRTATEDATTLYGAFAWIGLPQPQTRDLVQVVIPCGEEATYTLEVAAAGGETDSFAGTIPEPATLSVLVGLGLVALRRRK